MALARCQTVLNPENTIYSAKRFIGRRYNEVQDESKNVPFKVVSGPNDAVRFDIQGKQYAPEEISATVLRKLVEDAAKYLGEKVVALPSLACQKATRSYRLGWASGLHTK